MKKRVRNTEQPDDRHRREVLRLLARICRLKPEKGKKWISQEKHDVALYGIRAE